MCDSNQTRGQGWKGWSNIPSPVSSVPSGSTSPWIELSHTVSEAMPKLKSFPKPVFKRVRSIPEHPLNVTEMSFIVHCGTHVDSPRHFFLDGPAFEEIPFDRLWGPGLVWPIHLDKDERCIDVQHLKKALSLIKPGDMLLLNSHFHEQVGSVAYEEDHPFLSVAAAEWIVDRGVKFLGVDMPTPELPVDKRAADFDYPIHKRLLSQGILVAEHLTNLTQLNGHRVEIMCNALNIEGSDGSPARLIARKIN